ncbi:hypothetical protein DKK75_04635 [Bifidobacterium asteroides]|uniref:Uncharacterized protein n=1 Tax=Bifidobacterium asteroides TaxID=1684 RepID=A0A318MQS6_9BIFI|nr:hypothetical protein DKK75_04635 [Bifidobacterium asteroides]
MAYIPRHDTGIRQCYKRVQNNFELTKEQTGINSCIEVDNQMFNTMVSRNPGRDLHCSISLTQALLAERASQQHVSPFVPDDRMPQNTTEYPPLKVGFRRKLQDIEP